MLYFFHLVGNMATPPRKSVRRDANYNLGEKRIPPTCVDSEDRLMLGKVADVISHAELPHGRKCKGYLTMGGTKDMLVMFGYGKLQ